MTFQQAPSRRLNVFLWIAQILLASILLWSAWVKLSQSIEELSAMWPWTGEVSASLMRFTGIVDLLGAMGLILPSWLRIKPRLTGWAAIGIILLMVAATIFHVARGESSAIGVNIIFGSVAGFIAWGRLRAI